jgi:hypothetical protein
LSQLSSVGLSSTIGLGSDEAAWKKEGERIIKKGAVKAGAKAEMINIAWKSGRVVVTVDGSAYIQGDFEREDDVNLDLDDEFLDYEDYGNDEFVGELGDESDELGEYENEVPEEAEGGVDVVAIARAINAAFDEEGEGSVGYNVAVHHEIEVTTPGATDELYGIMFEAYKGFDVILETHDAKTGKLKKVEGKLVEKDDEFIRINQKGRMRKFKHELVKSVKLPKAKKEKGARR